MIVTACDKPLVLPETYARMVEEVKRGASCALLTATVENPLGYSRILRQGGRVVCSARQEALSGEQFMIQEVDASVYCFDIQALLEVLPLLQEDRQGEKHLCDAVGLLSGQGGLICAVPALEKCEALGVNDRFQLSRAEAAMRRRINARHMPGRRHLGGPGAHLHSARGLYCRRRGAGARLRAGKGNHH